MTIKEIENYWVESSADDLDTSDVLFQKKKYVQSLFFLHLSVEKLLKALYVNKNNTEAPFGHNLQNLAQKIPGIPSNKEKFETLAKITTFNIAARYDDYKRSFYKICTKEFTENYLKIGKEIIRWLKSHLK